LNWDRDLAGRKGYKALAALTRFKATGHWSDPTSVALVSKTWSMWTTMGVPRRSRV
jgi:hypothetical protein